MRLMRDPRYTTIVLGLTRAGDAIALTCGPPGTTARTLLVRRLHVAPPHHTAFTFARYPLPSGFPPGRGPRAEPCVRVFETDDLVVVLTAPAEAVCGTARVVPCRVFVHARAGSPALRRVLPRARTGTVFVPAVLSTQWLAPSGAPRAARLRAWFCGPIAAGTDPSTVVLSTPTGAAVVPFHLGWCWRDARRPGGVALVRPVPAPPVLDGSGHGAGVIVNTTALAHATAARCCHAAGGTSAAIAVILTTWGPLVSAGGAGAAVALRTVVHWAGAGAAWRTAVFLEACTATGAVRRVREVTERAGERGPLPPCASLADVFGAGRLVGRTFQLCNGNAVSSAQSLRCLRHPTLPLALVL